MKLNLLTIKNDPPLDISWAANRIGTVFLAENIQVLYRKMSFMLPTSCDVLRIDTFGNLSYDPKSINLKQYMIELYESGCDPIYMYSDQLELSIYSSSRDDLTIVSTALVLADNILNWLDTSFANHVIRGGIGFGSEGRHYLLELLQNLPLPMERKNNILSMID